LYIEASEKFLGKLSPKRRGLAEVAGGAPGKAKRSQPFDLPTKLRINFQ
jgi:hypothetical protein